MSSDALITLVVILALAAAAVIWLLLRQKRLKADLASLSPEDQKRHDDIVAANKALKAAQKEYDARVARAEAALREARTPRTLASCGTALVTETSVILNGNPRPLTPGITAQVDASGDIQKYATSRSTATRVVGGALLGGGAGAIVGGVAKKNTVHTNDTRQLFLIVTAPEWQEVVQLDPNLGAAARQFAATLYNVAPQAAQHLRQFQTRVVAVEQHHRRIVADTTALDAAKHARNVLELDPLDELRRSRAAARKEAKAQKSIAAG